MKEEYYIDSMTPEEREENRKAQEGAVTTTSSTMKEECCKSPRPVTEYSGMTERKFCGNCGHSSTTPEWAGRIEGSVKMLCGYYFHKEMAKEFSRAKDMQGLFEDEFKRLLFLVEETLSNQKQEMAKVIQDRIDTESEQHDCQSMFCIKSRAKNEGYREILSALELK